MRLGITFCELINRTYLLFVLLDNRKKMDSKILQYSLKIKKLLRKLLEPNFQVRSDADFNILLSHLAGKDDPGLCLFLKIN